MDEEPRKRTRHNTGDIDIRLDGLLGEIGRALGEALDRLGDGVSEVHRTEDIQTNKGPIRAEAGVRMRMGGVGGSTGSYEAGPLNRESGAREPMSPSTPQPRAICATIIEEPDIWSLTAEMPGVALDDIRLEQCGDQLEIAAASEARAYEGTFPMPSGIVVADIQMSFVNGILDLTARRK